MQGEELNKLLYNGNFYFIYQVDNIFWAFYIIKDYGDAFSLFLDSVYGVHIRLWDKQKEWQPDEHYHLLMINLRAPINGNTYVVRDLVATIVHELLHALGVKDESQVSMLEKILLEGYRYSRIKIK